MDEDDDEDHEENDFIESEMAVDFHVRLFLCQLVLTR